MVVCSHVSPYTGKCTAPATTTLTLSWHTDNGMAYVTHNVCEQHKQGLNGEWSFRHSILRGGTGNDN